MAIKNYTTTIDVYQSIGEIQGALASHGARKIIVDYETDGRPCALAFAIETPAGLCGFTLPANAAGVEAVMQRQKVKASPGQAERTAWRNVRDWVLAQMAIIEAGMVDMQEVFLPYMTNSQGQTLYQLYAQGCLRLTNGGTDVLYD